MHKNHILSKVLFTWVVWCYGKSYSSVYYQILVNTTPTVYSGWSFLFLSVRLCWFLRGHSVFSSSPQRPMTSNFERFSIQDLIHFIYFPILILEKEPVFPCLMLKKVIAGTIFITSLAWRGPSLGIEPGISRTRSLHSTTRLSRRRCSWMFLKDYL